MIVGRTVVARERDSGGGPRGIEREAVSDNLIRVSEITATDAARSFADLLDAVEHRGERFTIVRRGKAIAILEPIKDRQGTDVKALLRRHRPDSQWSEDLAAIRSGIDIEERP